MYMRENGIKVCEFKNRLGTIIELREMEYGGGAVVKRCIAQRVVQNGTANDIDVRYHSQFIIEEDRAGTYLADANSYGTWEINKIDNRGSTT
jgi:hypothetical protein